MRFSSAMIKQQMNKLYFFILMILHLKIKYLTKRCILPGGELNPGLPRDRRGYSPLYYLGSDYCKLSHGCYRPFVNICE